MHTNTETQPPAQTPQDSTQPDESQHLVGVRGWLAFFIIALGLSVLLIIINLAGYPSLFSEFASVQSFAPEFIAAATTLLWLEAALNSVLAVAAVWLIILILQHKKSARTLAIIFLIASPLFSIIDYAYATHIFTSHNLPAEVQSEMSSSAGETVRGIIGSLIWIPYFLVSKRVKATLTK